MAVHGEKLALVVRPVDLGLAALRLILLALLTIAVAAPPLGALSWPVDPESLGWARLLGLCALAVGLLHIVVTQVPGLSNAVNRLSSRARRRAFLACGRALIPDARARKFACRLVPADLRAPLFRYDRQIEVVSTLADSAVDDARGGFWVIEGPSGSGKTRMAYLLADALIRHPSEFSLADEVRYFDLLAGDSADLDAVRALEGSQLEGTITILDNFHRVGRRAIEALTQLLLDSPGGVQTRLLVLLARPTETWKLSPGADVRLVSEARRRGRHVALGGAPGLPVRRALASIDEDLAAQIRQLNGDLVASAAQLHLSRFAAANSDRPEKVAAVVGLLSASAREPADRDMVAFLAVIAALSMHRGFFSRRQFARAARLAAGGLSDRNRLASRLRLRATLWRMRRMGLVPWVRAGRGRYVFHEAVAELVIERLIHSRSFADIFETVGLDRLETDVRADPDVRWMIAAEVGADAELDARFDSAMLRGAFVSMARTLERVASRRELTDGARLQLGLLYDRTGDFARAREVIDRVGLAADSGRLAAEHLAALIEASHDEEALAAAAELTNSGDPLVASTGRYWEVHMAAHEGSFAPKELHRLSDEMRPLAGAADRWAVFTLARVHFDYMRHLYLCGQATAENIGAAANSEVSHMLRTALPTFDALSLLYTQAHLCAHVVLPRLALDRHPPTRAEAELIGVDPSSLRSAEDAAQLALELYERAHDEFWQYGDREARYLAGDVVNAELMIASPDLLTSAEAKLHSYADFIRGSGFADLASLPHMYFCRYHGLCYFDGLMRSGEAGRTLDEHLVEAQRHLREAARLDDAVGNVYGRLRADLFGLILDAAQRPLSRGAAESLRGRAQRWGYAGLGRTLETLDATASSGRLTNAEARTFLRFTPVVHQ